MTTTDGDPNAWADAMFADVGPARATRVFMFLANVLHPAMGGQEDLFQELCDAYDRVRP